MISILISGFLLVSGIFGATQPVSSPPVAKPRYTFRKLAWSDEFNYSGLPDSTKWKYNIGGDGWGNKELQ